MADKKIITQADLTKLEEELSDLTKRQRKEIAEKIREAREQGDLSENAEYDAAKEEQRHIEGRIAELESILKNVEIVNEAELEFDRVNIGSIVKLFNQTAQKEMVVSLVSSTEVSTLANRISNESPIGRALMGKKAGEEVFVEAPVGEIRFTILDVQRA